MLEALHQRHGVRDLESFLQLKKGAENSLEDTDDKGVESWRDTGH